VASPRQPLGITEGESGRPSPFVDFERDPETGELVIRGLPGGSGGQGSGIPLGAKGMNWGSIFGKIDPTTAVLSALSLFGGDDQQQRQSFREPGSITDPKQALYQALQSVYRMGSGLTHRKPASLRSSVVSAPIEPINIEGLPFQIGGGLGKDPALADPSLLQPRSAQEQGVLQFDPFQGIAENTFKEASRGAQLRRPNNG
jgi:hypothetical protein